MGLWNHFKGVEPPKQKENKATKDRKKIQADYEKKRKRSLKECWKMGREWLNLDMNKQIMKCDACVYASSIDKKIGEKNVFVKGCESCRFESVEIHEKTDTHKRALHAYNTKDLPVQEINIS